MNRSQDENLLLSNFYQEVAVVCPTCAKKAMAKVNFETKTVRLFCLECGCNKETSTTVKNSTIEMRANQYFQATLWLQATFKNEIFWAYNNNHLEYLERYISATIREHKDRTVFYTFGKAAQILSRSQKQRALNKLPRGRATAVLIG